MKELSLNILEIAKKVQKLEEAGGGGGESSGASKSDIATEFNTTTTYTKGVMVYYEGKLYQFDEDHTAGAWIGTDAHETNVADVILESGGGGVLTQHLTGLETDVNGCIFLDLAVDDYILIGATTKDFSAGYGPFFTIGIWQQYGTYKYMLRLTDIAGAAKASSNYWVDIHYIEREV